MSRNWKVKIPLLFIIVTVVATLFFGRIESRQYSAYAACRESALNTKGYAVWQHKHTYQLIFVSWIVFSDGYNDLTCQAVGIGPFWTVKTSMHTLVGCGLSLDDDGATMCPEGYFGVNP
jgi:hypothetical protein